MTICEAAPPAVPNRTCIIWKRENPRMSAAGMIPIGRPKPISSRSRCQCGLQVSFDLYTTRYDLRRNHASDISNASACATVVAHPEPAIPHPRLKMNTWFNTTLAAVATREITTVTRGRPIPLKKLKAAHAPAPNTEPATRGNQNCEARS